MIQYALALLLLACSAIHASEDAPELVVAEQRIELRPCEYVWEESEDGGDIFVDLDCFAELQKDKPEAQAVYSLRPCEFVLPESEDGLDIGVDPECLAALQD